MTPDILAALEQARLAKRPVVLATRLPDGHQRLLPDPGAPDGLNAAAAQALREDESVTVRLGPPTGSCMRTAAGDVLR